MSKEAGIEITRVFDAPRERLWREWTEPERFAEGVGYGPKTLQRIFRFQRMVGQLHAADTGLAGLAGYADQAHLSRESRRLAGLSPGQLARWVT